MNILEFKNEWVISIKNGKPTEKYVKLITILVEKEVNSSTYLFDILQENKKSIIHFTIEKTIEAINKFNPQKKGNIYLYFRTVAIYYINRSLSPNMVKLYKRLKRIDDTLNEK